MLIETDKLRQLVHNELAELAQLEHAAKTRLGVLDVVEKLAQDSGEASPKPRKTNSEELGLED